ncbi:SEC-C metal-binding domain-containing protein [Streptomyces vinaceus]|uniref:SEC-C metal-binding domain-containing protein n=1 Tax=Streptomyces vinaceus TaxID=1960 RepID=UPI003679AF0A
MNTRIFPTDEELDQFLDALPGPETLPVHALDQLQAADHEVGAMVPRLAATAATNGSHAYLTPLPEDTAARRQILKPALRMMLAAFSAGNLTHLCEHANQIRPTILICDPPALVCTQPACATLTEQAQAEGRFLWDNQCDACGAHAPTVYPYLTRLGPITISGHLCQTCTDRHSADARKAATAAPPAFRKSPCPCGSGRRYKRCHGHTRPEEKS